MEVPMIRSSHVVISRSTARLARRLARPFSKRKLFRATRVMWPALAALTVTSIAHAQGTMDFSGAQTLMGTFKTTAKKSNDTQPSTPDATASCHPLAATNDSVLSD